MNPNMNRLAQFSRVSNGDWTNEIENSLVLLVIAFVVVACALTKEHWQFPVLRFWRFILRSWQTLLFSGLCLLVPAAFRQFVGLSWQEYYEDLPFRAVTLTWLIAGGLMACLVLSWSAWGLRHHKVRALIGLLICVGTFWWTCANLQGFAGLKWRIEQMILSGPESGGGQMMRVTEAASAVRAGSAGTTSTPH